jgi:hypothetical protein
MAGRWHHAGAYPWLAQHGANAIRLPCLRRDRALARMGDGGSRKVRPADAGECGRDSVALRRAQCQEGPMDKLGSINMNDRRRCMVPKYAQKYTKLAAIADGRCARRQAAARAPENDGKLRATPVRPACATAARSPAARATISQITARLCDAARSRSARRGSRVHLQRVADDALDRSKGESGGPAGQWQRPLGRRAFILWAETLAPCKGWRHIAGPPIRLPRIVKFRRSRRDSSLSMPVSNNGLRRLAGRRMTGRIK